MKKFLPKERENAFFVTILRPNNPNNRRKEEENPARCDISDLTFVQDGARIHTSAKTTEFLDDKDIQVMDDWPPHSPDLNPIENLWAIAKEQLEGDLGGLQKNTQENRNQLWLLVEKYFETLTNIDIDPLIESFPRRLAECVHKKGAKTKY